MREPLDTELVTFMLVITIWLTWLTRLDGAPIAHKLSANVSELGSGYGGSG